MTAFINEAPEDQRNIMENIRQLIHESIMDVEEEFKWSRPIFRKVKNFAYLSTTKKYVTLGFFNFQNLEDPDKLLEGNGKDMRHIKIKRAADINKVLFKKWFKAAAK